ncbi:MAG: hypothetical protein R6V04_08995 [bacterium]
MNKTKQYKSMLISLIVIAIIIVIAGLQQRQEEIQYVSVYERVIKITVFFLIMLGVAAYWVIPNTKIAGSIKMTEKVFTVTSVIGIICGITGLGIALVWPEQVIELHLFELVLIPFLFMYAYWGIVMKIQHKEEISSILDEKQTENIKDAASTTLGVVTSLFLIFFFITSSHSLQLQGTVWFLIYFFLSLLIFSAATLFYFKKV